MVRRFYPNQPVVGVGAIIVCNGKILLEKRKGEPGKGKWSVPGGLVELGETTENAVIREVKEETGLEVANPQLIDVMDNIVYDENGEVKYHFVIIDYFLRLKGGEAKAADDAEELKWIPLGEVEKYDLTKTFRAFLQRKREKLEKLNSCL
ncbi:MAG: NUDIX hydrolase [Candidatus Bathyarchaeota archaeon]|jgi:mutator protein MutT|nr:NUDIX hydrolase [Candidatus Bathyarchaeota archaeon A05DMB-3]MDH7607429.1 NUDIX hydrolase [Candidatus Bathyarchaeota archaeon]